MNKLFEKLDTVALVLTYINMVVSAALVYGFFKGSISGEALTYSLALTYMCTTTNIMKKKPKTALVLATECVAIGAMLWTSESVVATGVSIAFAISVVIQIILLYTAKNPKLAV